MTAVSALDQVDDLLECFRAFEPAEEIHPLNWCIRNVINVKENPYDHNLFPHIGAPGGPMDAFADHRVREISLQWASRLGKSFFGQCMFMYTAEVDPAPMMLASSRETLALDVAKRTMKMIEKTLKMSQWAQNWTLMVKLLQAKKMRKFSQSRTLLMMNFQEQSLKRKTTKRI